MNHAEDLMTRDVISVRETASVRDVLKLLVRFRISGLPVVGERGEALGYISDGDILKGIGYHDDVGMDTMGFFTVWYDRSQFDEKISLLLERNVMELATRKVIFVETDTPIDRVAAILGKKRIKQVPVLRDRCVVGMIGRGDLIHYLAEAHLRQQPERSTEP